MIPYKEYEVSPKQIRNKTLISFLVFTLLIVSVVAGWKWLHNQPKEKGEVKPIRKVLSYNECF